MAQPLPSEHDIPKIFDECEKLKSWLCEDTTEFRNNQGMNECVDTSLDSKIEPLFRKLGFEEKPDYRVFHINQNIIFRPQSDRYPYDTIPLVVNTQADATISYSAKGAKCQVKVGTFIRVEKHAYYTPDWYCLVIPNSGLSM